MDNKKTNISEIQKEIELLKKDLDFYKLILDGTLDWEILLKPSGEFLYCSSSCTNITGYEAQEFLQNPDLLLQIVHPDDRYIYINHLNKKKNELDVENKIEFRIITKDGKEKWLDHICHKTFDYDGELIGYRSSNRDITDRVLAQEKLRESEAFLHAILKSTNDSIWAFNRNYEIQYINPRFQNEFYQSFGIKLEKGTNLLASLPSSLQPIWKERYDRALANEQFTIEDKVETQIGILYIEVTFNPIVIDGEVIGCSCFGRNITEQKKAELALRKSERNFRLLFEQSPAGILIANTNGEIIDVNSAFLSIFGSPSKEATKQINIFTSPNAQSVGFTQIFKDCIERKEVFYLETEYISHWGKTAYLYTYVVPLIDEKGEVTKIYTMTIDITDRKNAERELIIAKEKAQESDRLKSAFLANMSHEIRTPMNGILGFAQLLKEPNLPEEEKLEYVEMIEKSGQRMLNILNDIIDISKIEAGVVVVHNQIININQKINFIYNFFKLEAQNRGLKLTYQTGLPDELAIINTDSDKLYAILTNLIKNAIKFTDVGSIEFGYTKKDNELEFYVKDTGIGIPKDRQKSIFERFIQADLDDKMARQGAGLGLAIAKAYVEMLGGKIWVESDETTGSTFYFTLPFNTSNKINYAKK